MAERKFPLVLEEIILHYMPLSELLALEEEDRETAKILARERFWINRIQSEFKDIPVGDNPRQEYYNLTIDRMIKEGEAFEAGQLCLPIPDKLILGREDSIQRDFLVGAYLARCKYARLEKKYWQFPFWIALEEGNVFKLREMEKVAEIGRYSYTPVAGEAKFYSENMIDTWIAYTRNPLEVFYNLTWGIESNNVQPPLLAYFLRKYGREIPEDKFQFALDHMQFGMEDSDNIERLLREGEGDRSSLIRERNKLRRAKDGIRILQEYMLI